MRLGARKSTIIISSNQAAQCSAPTDNSRAQQVPTRKSRYFWLLNACKHTRTSARQGNDDLTHTSPHAQQHAGKAEHRRPHGGLHRALMGLVYTQRVMCFIAKAMAYSATTVLPADVCAATNTQSPRSMCTMASRWTTTTARGKCKEGDRHEAQMGTTTTQNTSTSTGQCRQATGASACERHNRQRCGTHARVVTPQICVRGSFNRVYTSLYPPRGHTWKSSS